MSIRIGAFAPPIYPPYYYPYAPPVGPVVVVPRIRRRHLFPIPRRRFRRFRRFRRSFARGDGRSNSSDEDSFVVDDDDDESGSTSESSSDDVSCDDLARDLSVVGDGRIEIRESTIQGAGLGLFARTTFRRGDPITEYYGQIITREEALERRARGQDSHIRSHIGIEWSIDGQFTRRGEPITDARVELEGRGAGALANDKARGANAEITFVDCSENVRRFRDFRRGKTKVRLLPEHRITYLRALRTIKPGEEIFVNYGAATRSGYTE